MPDKDYRGVRWDSSIQQWRSSVRHGGKIFNCGCHNEQRDAVKTRDRAILTNGLDVPLQILQPLKK